MKNRDMFYQNLNQGYSAPGVIVPPSGYNLNTQYSSYGPNVIPVNSPNTINQNYENNYEDRIDRLERQVKSLDTRLQKLESVSTTEDNNFYMI